MNLRLAPGQHIRRRDEADGTVQAHGVVVVDVLVDEAPRIFPGQRRARPDAFPFERFMPTLDLAVGRVRQLQRMPTVAKVLLKSPIPTIR